jgi:hypothetical protein
LLSAKASATAAAEYGVVRRLRAVACGSGEQGGGGERGGGGGERRRAQRQRRRHAAAASCGGGVRLFSMTRDGTLRGEMKIYVKDMSGHKFAERGEAFCKFMFL